MHPLQTHRLEDTRAWLGLDVFDHEGERVGRLTAIYADAEDGEPQFGVVRTGLFGLRSLLVPVAGAFEEGGVLIPDLNREAIKGSPQLRRDEPLAPEIEEALYSHYGIEAPPAAGGRPRLELLPPERAD